MARSFARRLPKLLRPWPLSGVRVVEELTDLGDRARVWRVRADDADHVAKLTFDARRYVVPGLRIASVLDRAGIRTGRPVPTSAGALCTGVRLGRWTLALLEFVPGTPFDWSEPERCGDLLGRVHHVLRSAEDVAPAGRLLDFYQEEADRVGGQRGAALSDAVAAVRAFDRDTGLTHGVLYGDPAPEVLRSPDDELALIDWGTPSWGPLLHDLVCWQRFGAAAGEDAAARLLSGYRTRMHLADAELAAAPLFRTLHRAIDAVWEAR
ncbi:phosphotransferase [Saccharopolyspora indica]|uniref:phosphotransferase enzyme family protein n=1 Tax=Saccharopolyspora indica TaxID=1229659 RepID=UPI0022EB065D|nr:phosphotransferase [Saccharopolyspora indica]MDA3648010.1 phosphotransferase [Saccharopolyspora indica]